MYCPVPLHLNLLQVYSKELRLAEKLKPDCSILVIPDAASVPNPADHSDLPSILVCISLTLYFTIPDAQR